MATLLMSRAMTRFTKRVGVTSSDHVLEQRGHVDESCRVANGVVLVLVMRFVDADCVEPGPLAVVQALAEGEGSLVDCRSYRHGDSSFASLCADYSYRERGAARLT